MDEDPTPDADRTPDDERAPANLIGQLLGDRYRLTAVLGSGGMGSAYLAVDEQMSGRKVAVKMPHEEFLLVSGFRTRFAHEINQLIDLQHPHIVTILDSGEVDGRPFAVLQYLGGGSLGDRLTERGGKMTVEEVRRWLPAVAESLDFIHRKGFLHRDVKPGNILFDTEGHPYIADFGTATAVSGEGYSRVTQAGTILGSPAFMAPEYGSDALGPAYDQYGLAVVVYRCLSGQIPHAPEPSPIAYLAKKMVEAPKPLGPLAPGTSSVVIDAVMRALSVRPEARFTSCTEFAQAVGGAAAAGATTGAAVPSTAYRPVAPSEPLAETLPHKPEKPRPAVSTSVAEQYELAAKRRAERRRRLAEQQKRSAAVEQQAESSSPTATQERARARDDAAAERIWDAMRWVLAFAIGFATLSEGSFALFQLANPLASTSAAGGAAALSDDVAYLVATAAAGNLLLSLLAGYVIGVIAHQHWRSCSLALGVLAIVLTGFETRSLGPLVNSGALVLVSSAGAWLSLAPVPLGIFAGGHVREQQDRSRHLGGLLAGAAVVLVIVVRVFVTSPS